ncbi:hypothetical protein B8X04_09235 [Brevibacterium casei]|uniref:Uncharacterized protein n=1 Tax=Brevibacterium casei TaxID=33889 RepID=A0A269ZCX9_9MICO|nr:hypothetical protein B8X04_09235 [Brevibacterium casei]
MPITPVSVSSVRTWMRTCGQVRVKMSNISAAIARSSSMTAPSGIWSPNAAVLPLRIAFANASMRRKHACSSADGPVRVRHDEPSG